MRANDLGTYAPGGPLAGPSLALRLARAGAVTGLLAFSLLALALILAVPRAEASGWGQHGENFLALSDLQPRLSEAEQRASSARARQSCPQGTNTRRTPSVRVALRRAQRMLVRRAGRRAMRKFRRHRDYNKVARLTAGAAAAIQEGTSTGALAAMLRARQLQPRNPNHLIDAAALLTDAGRPLEALALLNRANRLGGGRGQSGLGVSRKALALNNRGHALLALGRYRAAARPPRRAVAAAPLLAEARTNLSAVDLCRQPATRLADAGQRSNPEPVTDAGRHRSGPNPPPLEDVLRISFGTPATLSFPDPGMSPEWLARQEEHFVALAESYKLEADRAERLVTTAGSYVVDGAVEEFRRTGICITRGRGCITFTTELWRAIERRLGESAGNSSGLLLRHPAHFADFADWFGDTPCEDQRTAYRDWLSSVVLWNSEARQLAHAHSAAANGLAGAVRHPTLREGVLAFPKAFVYSVMSGAAYELSHAARGAWDANYFNRNTMESEYCFRGEPNGAGSPGEAEFPEGQPCAGLNGSISFGFYKFGIDCEKVTWEFAKPGWLGPFLRAEGNLRTGDVTVYGGVRAGGRVLGPAEYGLNHGVYVKVNRDGRVSDLGLRFELDGTAGAGGFESNVASKNVNVSLASSFEW